VRCRVDLAIRVEAVERLQGPHANDADRPEPLCRAARFLLIPAAQAVFILGGRIAVTSERKPRSSELSPFRSLFAGAHEKRCAPRFPHILLESELHVAHQLALVGRGCQRCSGGQLRPHRRSAWD